MFRNVFRLMGRRSDFFSKISEEDVTWGDVLAINSMYMMFMVGAISIEQYPIAGILLLLLVGFLAFLRKKAG